MQLFPITIRTLNLHVHCEDKAAMARILAGIEKNHKLLNQIVMTFEELQARLEAANAKLDKIITEISTTPNVPQNIVDLVTSLDSKLQAADDVNPDQPTEEPTEPAEGEEAYPKIL